jgi:integrase
LLATCDQTARRRRDRALLQFGFVGALRRSELVDLRVEDVAIVADGLRQRIRRGKTDHLGQGAEIGLPRWRHAETYPVRAFEAWQAVEGQGRAAVSKNQHRRRVRRHRAAPLRRSGTGKAGRGGAGAGGVISNLST